MADEVCPLCEGKGAGLPGYFGTMADMFTLLFAFFVLMFSMATMDPAKMSEAGGDDIGAAKEEEVEKIVEEMKKEIQEMKELGVTEINDQPIEEYLDSLIKDQKEAIKPPPKLYEIDGDLAEVIDEMELDSSQANRTRDVRGTAIELFGDFSFKQLSAEMKPEMKLFLDSIIDSFLTIPSDKRQIIIEGHSDNQNIPPKPKKYREKYPSNWELSSARASAVVRYFIDKGVNPARLVAHGYAERWPADLSWADMRRGHQLKPTGDNVEIVKGRGGNLEYSGGDRDEKGNLIFEEIPMDTIIDSLNSTRDLRAKNRRIKIIFTEQQYVDGVERSGTSQ